MSLMSRLPWNAGNGPYDALSRAVRRRSRSTFVPPGLPVAWQRSLAAAVLILASLAVLEGCGGGGGGHNGNGGGSGLNTVGLAFSNPPASITLVQGSGGSLSFVLVNSGGLASSGTTTVTMTLGNGVSFNPATSGGSGWDCSASTSTQISCSDPAVVQPAASLPTLTIALSTSTSAVSTVTQPTFSNPSVTTGIAGRSYNMAINVVVPPNVTIKKQHVGTNFTAANQGQYTISVNNTGNGPANNVAVTDTLPTGLTYVSAASGQSTSSSGGNWTCSASGQAVTCTMASAVAALTAATQLTLTVSVSSTAPQSIQNTASVTAQYDTGTTGKSSTDTVAVVLSTGSVTVTITSPSSTSVALGTGGVLDLTAVLANYHTNQVNWTANGVAGGNSTYGTISANTSSGATAVYTAPASVPSPATFTIQATAQDNPLAYASVTVTIVANRNAALKGQFAFNLHGFLPSGLPISLIGTFTAAGDAAGSMSKIFIDSNAATSSNASAFQSKIAWNGSYNMDSPTHGIMHLSLVSNSSTTMTFSIEVDAGGAFGYIAENDGPAGVVASGDFALQDTTSFDTALGHITGPWIFRHGHGRMGQVTLTATSSTTALVAGQEDDSSGGQDTISNGILTIDSDGTGHGELTFPLVNEGRTLQENVYIAGGANGSGLMYMISRQTGNGSTPGGSMTYQSMSSGYTNANVFQGGTAFEMLGANASSGHASVYIGQLAPSSAGVGNVAIGVFYNDAGNIVGGGNALGAGAYGAYSMDAAGTGRGTMTMNVPNLPQFGGTIQIPLVFYLRGTNEGYLLESSSSASNESRAGEFMGQDASAAAITNFSTVGLAGTTTFTPATVVGVSNFQITSAPPSIGSLGRGNIANGVEDIAQVGGQAIGGASFAGTYQLGGLIGPDAGAINLPSTSMFGSNQMALIGAGNRTIFGIPQYTGNAAQIADPSLITIRLDSMSVLVTSAVSGGPSNGRSYAPALSNSGRFLAFVSSATDLLVSNNPSVRAIYAGDSCRGVGSTCTPSLSLVSVADNGSLPNAACASSLDQPVAVSGGGRYYAFDCGATNLVSGGTSGNQVFLRDTCANTSSTCTPHTFLISQNSSGAAASGGTGFSGSVSISADGRFVVFTSDATNLVTPGTTGAQVFLRDTCNGVSSGCTPQTVLISQSSSGAASIAGPSLSNKWPSVDAAGRFVIFTSGATNLDTKFTNTASPQVYIRDTCGFPPTSVSGCTPSTHMLVLNTSGNEPNSIVDHAQITPDAQYVVFDSAATDLTSGGAGLNGQYQIFLRNTCAGIATSCTQANTLISASANGTPGNASSGLASISANDRFITFNSGATNLIVGAIDTVQDAFVYDDCVGAPGACSAPQLLSKTYLGVEGNGDTGTNLSRVPISGDGQVAAYASSATNLAPNSSGIEDVFYVPTGMP